MVTLYNVQFSPENTIALKKFYHGFDLPENCPEIGKNPGPGFYLPAKCS